MAIIPFVARDPHDWTSLLLRDGPNSTPHANVANALIALRSALEWQGVLAFNEFSGTVTVLSNPPWSNHPPVQYSWTDRDDIETAAWLQHHDIRVGREIAAQAVDTVARDHSFHPIREYLEKLVWDGVEYIDWWLRSCLDAEQTEYTKAIGAKFLIGGVARVMEPGCKFDTCLILEGPQGKLKSTALRELAYPWFTDELSDLGSKDAAMQLRGVWIVELSELDILQKAECSRVKAFLSRVSDRYRPPYGRRVVDVPRQCVFAGTVNHSAYLADHTGGRRFWPVRVGEIDIDVLRGIKDQLWAEAYARYRKGEPWWLDNPELAANAAAEQEDRYEEDVWHESISAYVRGKNDISIDEVLTKRIHKRIADCGQKDRSRVARSLHILGFERYKKRDGERFQWRYRRGPI